MKFETQEPFTDNLLDNGAKREDYEVPFFE